MLAPAIRANARSRQPTAFRLGGYRKAVAVQNPPVPRPHAADQLPEAGQAACEASTASETCFRRVSSASWFSAWRVIQQSMKQAIMPRCETTVNTAPPFRNDASCLRSMHGPEPRTIRRRQHARRAAAGAGRCGNRTDSGIDLPRRVLRFFAGKTTIVLSSAICHRTTDRVTKDLAMIAIIAFSLDVSDLAQ